MSGIVFYVQSDFDKHLKITPTPIDEISVTSIAISGDDSPYGISAVYTVTYLPVSASKKGVIWTIQSGDIYGEINQSGVLTIKAAANNSQIVIRATSIYDGSVYDEITVYATYNSGGLSKVIQDFCNRVISDSGILLKGTDLATQEEYDAHIALLGVAPKLDFLGYRQNEEGVVIKLYSVDEMFDCDNLTSVIIQNGVITTDISGVLNYSSNLSQSGNLTLTKMYYEGNVPQYGGRESVFIGGLLKAIYPPVVPAIFFMSNYISVQYSPSKTCCSSFPASKITKMLIEVDGNVSTENYDYVTKLIVNDTDILSTKEAGIDYWNVGIKDRSFIKIYNGFKLCIAG